MKVVLAFDKFKASATSPQLNDAAAQALRDCGEGVEVVCVPVADGGDGTVAVLAMNRRGSWVTFPTMGPQLQQPPVAAQYYLCEDGTALIEVAAASGLALLPVGSNDVMKATSLGTGMLMRDAMERGSRNIVLGLGGTATCDAAMGILCALGVEFLDAAGRHLFPGGESLGSISCIETRGVPQEVKDCHFTMLTDVDNPLCGPRGSARIFAPQKGATPQQVEALRQGLDHVAHIVGEGIASLPGCGAAGGIPSLMMYLLDCELMPGASHVLENSGLHEALEGADLVITGEGRLDNQTLMGKGPGCVMAMARQRNIPVVAVCGIVDQGFNMESSGLKQAVAVSDGLSQDDAMDNGLTLMRVSRAVRQIVLQEKNQ